MLEELVHFLSNGLFADLAPDFSRYLLRKHLFRVHFDRNQIGLLGDNTYENRIITTNLSSLLRAFISTLENSVKSESTETNLLPVAI